MKMKGLLFLVISVQLLPCLAINRGQKLELFNCANSGNVQRMKELINSGFVIDASGANALLLCAIRENHLKMVKFLIKQGADVHAHNEKALLRAVLLENREMVKFLVEKGARKNRLIRDLKNAKGSRKIAADKVADKVITFLENLEPSPSSPAADSDSTLSRDKWYKRMLFVAGIGICAAIIAMVYNLTHSNKEEVKK